MDLKEIGWKDLGQDMLWVVVNTVLILQVP